MFDHLNPMRYDGIASVDTKFAPILEKLLFKDVTFVPGVSFTTKYSIGPAGQIMIRKLRRKKVKEASATASGGLDFEHTHTPDDLIPIVLDKVLSSSEKVYEAVERARESANGAQIMESVVKSVREKFQNWAMDVLLAQGMTDATVTATSANYEAAILASRKKIRDNGGQPDILIMSTRVYPKFLLEVKSSFTPSTNEEILRTGALGNWFGFKVYESNLLEDTGSADSIEWILYDHEAFSILFNVETVRMVDAGKDFVGSYAQAQYVAGAKVTLPEAVVIKRVASAVPTVTVTFDTGAGSEVTAASVAIGGKVSKPTNPTLASHTFKGWLLGNLPYDFNQPVTENITLVAVWEEAV